MRNHSENDRFVELAEAQLRQLSDAQAVLRNAQAARQDAQEVRGSMRWKTVGGRQYLLRVSPSGAERSLGPHNDSTQAMFDAFHSRKSAAQARLITMRQRLDEMRQLNRVYQVGRVPAAAPHKTANIAALAVRYPGWRPSSDEPSHIRRCSGVSSG